MLLPLDLLLVAMRGWTLQNTVGSRGYWIGLGLLVVVLLFGLYKGYREWQEIHDVEEPDSPEDLLRSFREAHALGELDDDEMRRVEERLSVRSAAAGSDNPVRLPASPRPSGVEPRGEGPSGAPAEGRPGNDATT
jgi:hypothetical protein